jgi:hypothetical protein
MDEWGEVIAAIRRAFDQVVRPDCTLADTELDDEAADAASSVESGCRHWWDLPDEYVERSSSAFCMLPPRSIPYYLAGYMSLACRANGKPAAGLMDDLELFLTRPDQFGAILDLLSPAQRVAVARFVRLMADESHRQLAAEGFTEPELRELNYYRQSFEDVWKATLT